MSKPCHHLRKLKITFQPRKARETLVILSAQDLGEVRYCYLIVELSSTPKLVFPSKEWHILLRFVFNAFFFPGSLEVLRPEYCNQMVLFRVPNGIMSCKFTELFFFLFLQLECIMLDMIMNKLFLLNVILFALVTFLSLVDFQELRSQAFCNEQRIKLS